MDERIQTLMRDASHRWTAEEVAERDLQLEIDKAGAEAVAKELNEAEEAKRVGDRTQHHANGGSVQHVHPDGRVTQTELDGTEWLVTSGDGLWYADPDDLIGQHSE